MGFSRRPYAARVNTPSTSLHRVTVRSASSTFLSFAVPIAMLGIIWPDVRERFDQSLGTLGVAALAYGLGRMSTALTGPTLVRWFGMGRAFVVVLLVLASAILALALSVSWTMFLVCLLCIGLASGSLDSLGAGFITAIRDVGSAGQIHGAYGVGASAGPLLVVLVPDWRAALCVSAAMVLLAAGVAYRTRGAWPEIAPHVRTPGRRPPFAPAALSLGAFCAFVAIEVTTGQWAFTHLTEARGSGETLAAIAVSLFWGGVTVGRLALTRPSVRALSARIGLSRLAVIALASAGLLAVVPPVLAVPALAVAGLVLAPIVPSLFASTAARVGEEHAQRLAVFQLLATNLGAVGVPFLTGQLVDATDASVIVVVIATAAAAGALLLGAIERLPAYD